MYDAPPGLLTTLGWILAGLVALLGIARAVAVERRAGRAGTDAAGAGTPKEMSGVGVTFTVLTALAVGTVAGVLAAVVAAGLG